MRLMTLRLIDQTLRSDYLWDQLKSGVQGWIFMYWPEYRRGVQVRGGSLYFSFTCT